MHTLLLMRHAKSSWDDASQRDHDRPLTERGHRAAHEIGALLARESAVPDLILSSTAVRTRETVAGVLAGLGVPVETRFVSELYHAGPADCLAVAATAPEDCRVLLVVAHNPGLEQLVATLARREERFPTAALARFELDIGAWAEVESALRARLVALWRPKEL